MTRTARWLAAGTTALAALLLLPLVALAHPLGNFTVNHYSGIEVAGQQLRVHFVLDLAEIPAFQERGRIDADPHYLDHRVSDIADHLSLTIDGNAHVLRPVDHTMRFLPGQGGLDTLRIEAILVADLPAGGDHHAVYRDNNDVGRLGWREITVTASDGARIDGSDAPSQSATDELRTYPQDLLTSPLDVEQASISFTPGSVAPAPRTLGPLTGSFSAAQDRFAALIAPEHTSWSFVIFAVVAAVALGAAHALSPGHGKAVVAGYMVASRRSWRPVSYTHLTLPTICSV